MSDINIEFAHIYINENASSEHYKSALLAKEKIDSWLRQGLSISSCVLIDDYNPEEYLLNIDGYLKELGGIGVPPKYVVFESALPILKDQLLEDMGGKLQKQYRNYINKSGKSPCSFLVAAWHLTRLGIYKPDNILDSDKCIGSKEDFSAERITTVLPYRFGGVEKKALDIIRTTSYYETVSERLEHVFF